MSRTVRTTPGRLRVRDGMSESVSLYDLRYAHAELSEAAREGRRPAPHGALHRVTSWRFVALDCRTSWFSAEVATAEARARLRVRLAGRQIRGLHRAGHDIDGADIAPDRHRHDVLWHA